VNDTLVLESTAPAPAVAEPPSVRFLDRLILDTNRDMPLHAQLRRALRVIIDEHCINGQKFFTEPQLIKYLNVSQSTVRRALLDLTRDGLLDRRVAKGSFVRKLNRKSSTPFTVNVFLPAWNSEFLMTILEALSNECKRADYRFHIHYTHQGESMARSYRAVEGGPEDGGIILLCNEPRATLDLYESFSERHYRVVNMDSFISGYPGAFVGTSNEDVVRIALDHLQSLGHRRIVFLVNEPEENGNVIDRTQIFERSVADRGLANSFVFHCGTHHFEDGYVATYRKMRELMAGKPRPTAIFAMSDPGAWAAMKWCVENDIAIPGQVSVLGFSDDRPSRFTYPALTTIAHPVAEIAQCAMQFLLKPDGQKGTRLLTPKLVVRESTGPAPER
jgi:DNA-binding LacI/PurR family transcriptional regulator